jgi:hypothetical protein
MPKELKFPAKYAVNMVKQANDNMSKGYEKWDWRLHKQGFYA